MNLHELLVNKCCTQHLEIILCIFFQILYKCRISNMAMLNEKTRAKKLKEVIQAMYFDNFDDYFDAKDQLLADLNTMKDGEPFIYKNGIIKAIKKAANFDGIA